MKITFSSILILFFILNSFSQTTIQRKIDSMNTIARISKDSVKYDIYNQIAFYYVFKDSIKADSILKVSIRGAQKAQDQFSEAQLTNTLGILKAVHGDYDSANYYYNASLKNALKNDFKVLEGRAYNNIGLSYWNNGQLAKAQEYFFKGLDISMKYRPDDAKDSFYNNIGLIYQELEEIDKALIYHQKALNERISKKFIPEQIPSYNNIGICYKILGKYDDALESYRKGLVLADSTSNYTFFQSIHNNIGNALVEQEKYLQAISNFQKAIKSPPEGNLDAVAQQHGYGNLGYVYLMVKKNELAKIYIDKGLENLKKNPSYIEDSETVFHAASLLKAINGEMVASKKLYDSLETLRTKKFSADNANAIAEYEAKYETAQKEADLAETRATLAEKELEVRKKNYIAFGLGGGALLLALLGYLFYKQQRLKNRQQAKEFELEKALVKIETQNRLQEQRLRISRDLHDNIGSQLTFITSSLDNLKYGMKEKEATTKNKLTEIGTFTKNTINELRDTIWAMNKEEITFEDLEARLANLVDQAQRAAPRTNFTLGFDKQIDRSQSMTSVEGMNLYRIIQEAANNAIKYAGAEKIEITLSRKHNNLIVTIKDDGKGFDTTNPQLGNGLTNMRKRAKDIGARYSINSKVSKGTTISLEIDS